MADLATSAGAYLLYGALLAFAGGFAGNWIQHRRDQIEGDRQRAQDALLEMFDIILPVRLQWISVFVIGSSERMTPDAMEKFASSFMNDLARLRARSFVVDDAGVLDSVLVVTKALEFWVALPPGPEKEDFKKEVTKAFDDATGELRGASRRLRKS